MEPSVFVWVGLGKLEGWKQGLERNDYRAAAIFNNAHPTIEFSHDPANPVHAFDPDQDAF
jgi:hypothetical protein